MTPVLRARQGVTLIGGGAVTGDEVAAALALAPEVMAADGGADQALAHGLMPAAVVGDFDSISDAARAAIAPERLHRVAEQDSTDFEKCLQRLEAPFVIALGFSGRRLDHTLAALSVLMRQPDPPCVMLAEAEAIFPAPADLALDLPPGTRLSLFPMGVVRGTSRGLRWPIDGLEFTPAGRVGTSNEVSGPVRLRLEGPMLVLLPADHLASAVQAVGGAGRAVCPPS